MEVGPKHRPSHLVTCMQHVVMVVPIDAEVDETQHITQKHRDQWRKGLDALTMRHLQLQHHDGDDDGDDAIAECFKPTLAHSYLVQAQKTSTLQRPRLPTAARRSTGRWV